jgi:hypothetical protein
VVISLFTGVPVILYIIALFVMPEDTASQPTAPPPVTGAPSYPGPYSATEAAAPAPAYTPYPGQAGTMDAPRATAEDAVWGTEGPPWEQRQPEPTPSADEPVATAGLAQDGTPSQPVAPSEPEAPVVPPAEDQPKTDDKPPS